MKHNDFIRLYFDAIDEKTCEYLINLFEMNSDNHEIVNQGGTPNFTQLNLQQLSRDVLPFVFKALNEYKKELPEFTRWFPSQLALEEIRIKRYNSNSDDRFDPHVDVKDLTSSKRYLAFLFYLNEGFEGGDTIFNPGLDSQTTIIPFTGSVVVFPPTWQYPHQGMPVTKGTKYIMSTYLNFT